MHSAGSQQSYLLVSANYMIINIISCMHAPHLPYTSYREGQVIGRVNKPFAGALNNRTKASLEYQSSLRRSPNLPMIYWSESIENVDVIDAFDGRWPAVGIERQLSILERKVLNNRLE